MKVVVPVSVAFFAAAGLAQHDPVKISNCAVSGYSPKADKEPLH